VLDLRPFYSMTVPKIELACRETKASLWVLLKLVMDGLRCCVEVGEGSRCKWGGRLLFTSILALLQSNATAFSTPTLKCRLL
jgi:hypothetical protein